MILFWKFKELSCPADGDLQVKSQLWSHPFFCYYLCCQASQRVRTQVQWSLRTCVSLVWIPAQTVPSTTTPSCSWQRLFKNSEQRHFSDRVSSHQVVWVCDSRSYSGALHESSWWHRLPGWPVQISCRTNCRETQWGFRLTVLDWTEGRLTMKKCDSVLRTPSHHSWWQRGPSVSPRLLRRNKQILPLQHQRWSEL